MRLSRVQSIFFILIPLVSALQVAPNSPCSTLCMDDVNDNPSDPNSSNTNGTDIACDDADFNTTFVGEKFQSCLNCLQDSAYTSGTESDQSWFLYNLRYALGWCVFGYPNNGAAIAGPCSIETACGSLSTALESDISNPSGGSTYDYCSADGGAFQAQNVAPCTSCLMGLSSNTYLSNFLVALQAGCEQQPTGGLVIGLNETLFTSIQVAITTASLAPSTSGVSTGSSSLSLNAKVGIIVAGLVVLLIITGVIVVLYKKRQRKAILASHYELRIGAPEISVPITGRFVKLTDPASQTNRVLDSYNPTEFRNSETSPWGPKTSSSVSTEDSLESTVHKPKPSHTGTTFPVHQAYGPNHHSRDTSIATTPPNSAPIRARNFSTPIGTGSQNSPVVASARSPSAGAPSNPSTYPSRLESGLEEQKQQERERTSRPDASQASVRPTAGRTTAWNPVSTNSVELWPGSM